MRRNHGFTLIELMVTLAVLAVVLTIAAPSFQEMIDRNRARSTADGLVTALVTARTEAVSRNEVVTLCPSANGTSCTTGASVDWQNGWLLFEDGTTTYSGDPSVDADARIKIFDKPHSAMLISVTPVAAGFVRFMPTGMKAGVNNVITFHLQPEDCKPGMAWDVTVAVSGHAAVEAGDCDG